MMGPPSTAAAAAGVFRLCSIIQFVFFLIRVIYLLSLFYTFMCNPCPVSESLFPFLGYLLVVFI